MVRRLSVLAALLAFAAPAFAASGDPRIHVAPRHGGPRTIFVVGFTAPEAAGHQGVVERSYFVSATGPRGSGCVQGVGYTIDEAQQGERVRQHIWPIRESRRDHWCSGLYKGTIALEEGPFCESGQPCPEFATRTRTIGRFRFRVR